jgi:peptidoglycan hydrolase-like protein with peptidoglycan-binding domain
MRALGNRPARPEPMGPAPQVGATPTDHGSADDSGDGAHSGAAGLPGSAGAPPASEHRDGRRRRRRILAAGAIVVVLAAVVAFVLLDSSSPSHRNSSGAVPAGETTTAVTRRTLAESATVDGTLAYGSSLELYDRLSGTYTWLPSVGAVLGRGGTLWRIDDLPVLLMYGAVPAYRTLKEGVSSGPDVVELNRNLIDLGFDPYGAITDVEDFSEATAEAVRRLQRADGLPETGAIELGRVVFAPGARRVTAVHVQLGQDPSGSPAPTRRSPSRKHPSKTSPSKKTPARDSPSRKSPSEDSPSTKSPSEESGAKEPESGGAAEAVLSTTPTQQLVQLKLKPSQQGLVHAGQSAPVTLPSGGTAQGRVIAVGSVASESSSKGAEGGGGESESATIAVTLALERTIPHLDEAPVSVEFVKAVRRDVLAVPATALIATAGGGYAIEALERGRPMQLPVSTGMFADGYVQVEGAGVQEGLTVLESE